MVAINYAKDIRVGEQPVKAAALGSNFVWPPLPDRLFFRGQTLVYDFVRQRYGVRRPGYFTLVAGEALPGVYGYASEALSVSGVPPTGSISKNPFTDNVLYALIDMHTSNLRTLTIIISGDLSGGAADGVRMWVDGVEATVPIHGVTYAEELDVTQIEMRDPNMAPWVAGGQYTIGITLDGSEPSTTIDYTTNVNDLGIVSRASTATYWGPEGSLLEAAVDEARVQHDPVTGKALGLLVESSRTSAFPYSCDPGTWNYNRGVVLEQGHPSPIPGYTSTRVSYDGESSAKYVGSSQWRVQGLNSAVVIYRPINGSSVFVGQMSSSASGTTSAVVRSDGSVENRGTRIDYLSVKPLPDGFLEIRFTLDMSHYSSGWVIGIGMEGETDSFDLAYFQNEYEVTPPSISHLITDGTNVTRAADNAVIDLSDVWNPTSGTLVVEATIYETVNGRYGAVFLGADTAGQTFGHNAFGFYVDSGAMNFGFQARRLAGDFFNLPGFVLGQPFKMAMSWSVGSNLVIAAQGVSATHKEVDSEQDSVEMVLLSRVGKFSNGVVKQLLYFPHALSAAELEALTAL